SGYIGIDPWVGINPEIAHTISPRPVITKVGSARPPLADFFDLGFGESLAIIGDLVTETDRSYGVVKKRHVFTSPCRIERLVVVQSDTAVNPVDRIRRGRHTYGNTLSGIDSIVAIESGFISILINTPR